MLTLAVLTNEIVAPGSSVEYLEVTARIGIATARIVTVILYFSPENGLAGTTLHYVQDQKELEVYVEVVINLEVLDIKLEQLLLVKG